MNGNVKGTIKVPALLIVASFIIVVAGMKAASSLLVPFFLAVFIAVICAPPLFWLQRRGLLGPIGMILSVPMTSMVKIALESHEETRGLAIMLGSGSEVDPIQGSKRRKK
jgi:predicted PurR-regulated permease PerM